MIQKYFTQNPYQIPSSNINQFNHNNKVTSPKLQSSKSRPYQINNQYHQQESYNNPVQNSQSNNQEQSSQSYSSYYANRLNNNANSSSLPSSYPSKHSRTQNSKQKLIMQNKNQQLKQQFQAQQQQRSNNLLSNVNNNQQLIPKQSTQRVIRHLKTQTSKTRVHQHEIPQNKTNQNLKASNYSDKKSQNGSFNPQIVSNNISHTQINSYSPFQEYYASKQQQYNTRNDTPLTGRLPNHRIINSGSRDTSTVNTKNRPSSLSLNKFVKKPMLTFYHCQRKKLSNYNDQGYLTNREFLLRQKIQKQALQTLDRALQSDASISKTRKSKSLAQFPKINSLKQKADKQRKKNYELYGNYRQLQEKYITDSNVKKTLQLPAQKPYSPSQLPPTSTLSNKKFNIIYKADENENLLGKNQINDDSYHERQQKKIKSQFVETKQNLKRMKSKNTQSQTSQISSRESLCRPIGKTEVQNFVQHQNDRKRNSKLPSINSDKNTQSRESFSQDISEQSKSQYSSKKSLRIPSQLSQNSKYSENRSKRPIQKSHNQSKQYNSSGSSKNQGQLKNESKVQDQSQLGLKSKQSKGGLDQSDMINSNYNKKKSVKVQQKSKLSSKEGSLNLLSKNQKISSKLQNKISSLQSNEQLSKQDQLGFQSKVSLKKQSKSDNVSQVSLKKQSEIKQKQQVQQKSEYSSSVSIGRDFKKKSSLKEQGILPQAKTQQHIIQKAYQVNMKRKSTLQVDKLVSKFQSALPQNNNESELRLSSKHSSKSSVHSQYLQLDSGIRKPKSLKLSKKKQLTPSQNANHTAIKQNLQSQQSLHLNSQPSQGHSKRSSNKSNTISQLFGQSKQSLRMDSKISNQVKNSHLSQKQQQQNIKALSQKSHKSHRTHRSSRSGNIHKISLEVNKQNKNEMKYGNYLSIDNKVDSASKQGSSTSKKQIINSKISERNNKKQNIKKQPVNSSIKKESQFKSISNSNYSNQEHEQFNLIDRVDQLLNFEEDLHQKRRKLEEQQSITEEFQDFISKIEGHLFLLRQILDVSVCAIQMYSDDSVWVFRSCLFALKKYHLERNKIVDSLNGKKSCFKIAEYELIEQDLKQFLTHPEIQLLSKDIQQCNQLLQTLIQELLSHLHQYENSSINELNSKPFDDRFDLGVLLEEFRTQIIGLKDKKAQQNQNEQQFEQETQEVINKRIFKLMEVTFLLSELAGKRIKQFTEEIDYVNDFQEYYDDYWPYFQRIVKTFA